MLSIPLSDNARRVIVGSIADKVYQSPGQRMHCRSGKVYSIAEGRKRRERRERREILAVDSAFRTECCERRMLMMRAFRCGAERRLEPEIASLNHSFDNEAICTE